MADREVTQSVKNFEGDITALCKPGEWWSPRQKQDAVKDIESGLYRYFVRVGGRQVDIHVVSGSRGKYLRTDPDATTRNNLDDLPDCMR
jgi:hypothetical protein